MKLEVVEIPEDPAGVGIFCQVTDSDHPAVTAVFRFLVDTGSKDQTAIRPHEVRIRVADPAAGPLDVAKVRDLPLGRWERAALSVVAAKRDGTPDIIREVPITSLPDEQRSQLAARLVDDLYPGLDKDDSLAGRRRRSGLLKLALVSLEYRALLLGGRDDPATEIARKNGVPPATARSWIHRARKAGFLGESAGRTAGERRDPRAERSERDAARAYAQAVTFGSRSPMSDVAVALGVSTGQASRLVRKAREVGFLPPLGEPVADPTHKRLTDGWTLFAEALKANEQALADASNDEDRAEFAGRVEDFRGRLAKVETEWRTYRAELRRRGLAPTPLPADLAHLDDPS